MTNTSRQRWKMELNRVCLPQMTQTTPCIRCLQVLSQWKSLRKCSLQLTLWLCHCLPATWKASTPCRWQTSSATQTRVTCSKANDRRIIPPYHFTLTAYMSMRVKKIICESPSAWGRKVSWSVKSPKTNREGHVVQDARLWPSTYALRCTRSLQRSKLEFLRSFWSSWSSRCSKVWLTQRQFFSSSWVRTRREPLTSL